MPCTHNRAAVPRLARMELRDGDLVLRPWTEDDVDAMVAGCNDPEVARWIPTIPHPYTEDDALAFIRGEVAPDRLQALAIEVDGRVVGGIGHGRRRARLPRTSRLLDRGLVRADGASARARCACSRAMRSRSSSSSASISSPIRTTSPPSASPRRSGFQREGVLRAHLRHPDGRIRDSVMFSLLPGELRE